MNLLVNLFFTGVQAFAQTADNAANVAAAATAAPPAPAWMQFVPFVIIIGVFYFFLIRPKTKKQKETQSFLESLKVGDQVDVYVENQEDLDDIFDIEKDINLDDIDDFINSMDNTQNDEKEDIDNFQELVDFNDNFGLNNISYDYDDDDVLFREESIKNNEITPENDVDNFKDLNLVFCFLSKSAISLISISLAFEIASFIESRKL